MPKSIRTTSNTQTTTTTPTPTHQALNGLPDAALPMLKNAKRRVLDTTAADDKEVIVLSSHDLSDIACDIDGALTTLQDIGHLFSLISGGDVPPSGTKALTRMAHEATSTWANILAERLAVIDGTLNLTAYGKGGK